MLCRCFQNRHKFWRYSDRLLFLFYIFALVLLELSLLLCNPLFWQVRIRRTREYCLIFIYFGGFFKLPDGVFKTFARAFIPVETPA